LKRPELNLVSENDAATVLVDVSDRAGSKARAEMKGGPLVLVTPRQGGLPRGGVVVNGARLSISKLTAVGELRSPAGHVRNGSGPVVQIPQDGRNDVRGREWTVGLSLDSRPDSPDLGVGSVANVKLSIPIGGDKLTIDAPVKIPLKIDRNLNVTIRPEIARTRGGR